MKKKFFDLHFILRLRDPDIMKFDFQQKKIRICANKENKTNKINRTEQKKREGSIRKLYFFLFFRFVAGIIYEE